MKSQKSPENRVGQAGLEQGEEVSGNTVLSEEGGAGSGAVGAPLPVELQIVVEAWEDLPAAAKRKVLAIIAETGTQAGRR